MEKLITTRQKELLSIIYEYFKSTGYPPTFEEMREGLGVSSNQSVMDLLEKLEEKGIIKREEGSARGIKILKRGLGILDKPSLIPLVGVSSAGAGLEAFEVQGEWLVISKEVSRFNDNVFLVKISGDSMINAGIDDGDTVLVKEQKEFVSGDIVLAQHNGETMVKRFVSEDKPPYVYLKPENPKYDNILFTNEMELKGKVVMNLSKVK